MFWKPLILAVFGMLVSHLQSCWRVIDFHGRCDFWLEYYFVNIWFCYFIFSGNGTINLTNHKHSSLSVFCVKVSTVCGGKIFTQTFHVNLIWILRANFVVVLLHVFSFFLFWGFFPQEVEFYDSLMKQQELMWIWVGPRY